MPTAWSLSQLQASVGSDLTYVDGVQTVSFQQLDQDANTIQEIEGVNGFLEVEAWQSIDGLEVIARTICLQSNQMSNVTRINETDQVVDEAGAIWVLRSAQLIIWDTQWKALGIRLDCLISIQGMTADVEQIAAVKDAVGGFGAPNQWIPFMENVPIRIQAVQSQDLADFGKKYMSTRYNVFTRQAGITIGMRFNTGAEIYKVTDVTEHVQRNPDFPTWYTIGTERKQDLQGG